MTNVTDISEYVKRRQADDDGLTVLSQYGPHSTQFILDIHTKLEIVGTLTLNGWLEEQDVRAQEAHRLGHIAKDMLHMVHLPFDVVTGISVREEVAAPGEVSLYLFASDLARYRKAMELNAPLDNALQLQLSYFELGEPGMTAGAYIDPMSVVIKKRENNTIAEGQMRQIILNLDRIARVNNGMTTIGNGGQYIAMLPYSGRYTIVIAVVGDLPFERATA